MLVKSLITAAALAMAPALAGAVTVDGSFSQPGNNDLFVGTIGSGNAISDAGDGFTSVAWMFTAQEDLRVHGTGTVNGVSAFIQPIEVSYSSDGVTPGTLFALSPIENDTQSYLLPSLLLAPGDVFYVLIEYAGAIESDADIDFRLTATAVPLPGAGLMFITALAGMGFLARRRATV